ncbi:pantothenate kinase [Hypnocyclicus thermotrophus]|uniref:Type III pantothenate kinase n=1 Tax=Hypnocyclicus thermotrophus TaxID=1627895 RepID=A0AA46DXB6_9FUSO|nr:type III pantothenate kinase [Hypnocyclicus thermotrophus]TDT68020.1 pantothenate kinase [Hypnocyclicus thermotrophus]
MLIGFDIGNTHIVTGIYTKNAKQLTSFRIATNANLTEDQYFSYLKTLSDFKHIDLKKINSVVISSVVPNLTNIFKFLSIKYFDTKPLVINSKIKLPFTFSNKIESPSAMGADRIVDISEAMFKYPDKNEIIIIDFGTATTFEIVKNNTYLGGCILPGVNMSIDALFSKTSKLPKVRFEKPETVLGRNTIEHINTGIYYGAIGQIKELITQYKAHLDSPYIISTGGVGKIISHEIDEIDEYIETLAVDGLYSLYQYNKKI